MVTCRDLEYVDCDLADRSRCDVSIFDLDKQTADALTLIQLAANAAPAGSERARDLRREYISKRDAALAELRACRRANTTDGASNMTKIPQNELDRVATVPRPCSCGAHADTGDDPERVARARMVIDGRSQWRTPAANTEHVDAAEDPNLASDDPEIRAKAKARRDSRNAWRKG